MVSIFAHIGLLAAWTFINNFNRPHLWNVFLAPDPDRTWPRIHGIPSLGFYDPLGVTKNCTEEEFKKWRKSEIRHGRAVMMASMGLAVQSIYKLLGCESVPSGLGALWTEPGSGTLLGTVFLIGCFEIVSAPGARTRTCRVTTATR
jgi:hypothetical protein